MGRLAAFMDLSPGIQQSLRSMSTQFPSVQLTPRTCGHCLRITSVILFWSMPPEAELSILKFHHLNLQTYVGCVFV